MKRRRDNVSAGNKAPFHLLQRGFRTEIGVDGVDHGVNVVRLSYPNLIGCLDPQGVDPGQHTGVDSNLVGVGNDHADQFLPAVCGNSPDRRPAHISGTPHHHLERHD